MKKTISLVVVALLVLTTTPVLAGDSLQGEATSELKVMEIEETQDGDAFIVIVEEYPKQQEAETIDTEDLTTKEIRKLDGDEIDLLSPEQMGELSEKQVESLETEEIQQMDPEQIDQIEQMAPEQIDQMLADQAVADVELMQGELPEEMKIQDPETVPESDEHILQLDQQSPSEASLLSGLTSYFATPSYAAASGKVRNGRKTVYYKNADGKIMWSVTVHGKFSYVKGKSATCTSSISIASAPSNAWKISSSSASKTSNRGTAYAKAKRYFGRFAVETQSKYVSLYCDTKGTLY